MIKHVTDNLYKIYCDEPGCSNASVFEDVPHCTWFILGGKAYCPEHCLSKTSKYSFEVKENIQPQPQFIADYILFKCKQAYGVKSLAQRYSDAKNYLRQQEAEDQIKGSEKLKASEARTLSRQNRCSNLLTQIQTRIKIAAEQGKFQIEDILNHCSIKISKQDIIYALE